MDPRLLAVVGPTASGKNDVATRIAVATDGEIVSCDSVQVYRGFEIGCAKPSANERARVAHHLLDVVDWNEAFDAQRYRELATAAITDARSRGKRPILCGGTGLYLRSLRWGLMDAPPADPDFRNSLLEEEAEEPGTLYARLQRVDLPTAQQTDPHNFVRIIRALELHSKTGEPASTLRARHGFASEVIPMHVVALQWPVDLLRGRIDERSAKMVHDGLLDEVARLLAKGVSPDCRPMRAVGYREACAVVRGDEQREGLQERIAHSTWAYARRQRTWLNRERDIERIDVTELSRVVEQLMPTRH